MIRPTVAEEVPALVAIAEETAVFKPPEIVALREVLEDYFAGAHGRGHRAITSERDGRIAGFAYYAAAAMTDRTWYLYWIAVDKRLHARGVGSEMLRHAEEEIRRADGRLFLIETSSLSHYAPTRAFYIKHGYDTECVIRDFYADGDDLVVFRKRLAP
jgi:ribosomal protein S18 acetylase RimI-like enzyme